jgi:REP element-mobilizing transposase RayT
MARGVDGRVIFSDDGDRRIFLASLAAVKTTTPFHILAYCLMGNHFHLAVQTEQRPLSTIMHRLLTRYSITFNLKHERTGHLFQARYKAMLCRNDAYLHSLVRYIHQNPVRAGLVSDAAEWPWSSLNFYRGRVGTDILTSRELLSWNWDSESVLLPESDFEPWPQVDFIPPSIQDGASKATRLAELQEIAHESAHQSGVSIEELLSKSRRREVAAVRKRISISAFRKGYLFSEIARFLGVSVRAVSLYRSE